MDEAIQALIDQSNQLVERGADAEHHQTYQDVVREAGARPYGHELVVQLRQLYAESQRAERDGEPRQPTYRRALVHVLAARMSEQCTKEVGRSIVISPIQARPVLDSAPSCGAVFTSGDFADAEDVILRAIARADQ